MTITRSALSMPVRAIRCIKRCPNPMVSDSEIEIRPFFEPADFGETFTPELQDEEKRLRQQIDGRRR